MDITGQKIILGVTGSIAAYKAVELLRLLKTAGSDIHVVQTASSLNFIGETTFCALSGHDVATDFLPGAGGIRHIELANADAMVIAPATANTIGKMAAGLADNLLLSTYLATEAPVILCPAMNHLMWNHAAVRENIDTVQRHGVYVVMPGSGALACGSVGDGRMAEPVQIFNRIGQLLSTGQKSDLDGLRVLVTAGATREPIDSIRFITNRSSGRMGFALADAAFDRGASVTVIAANCSLQRNPGISYIDVQTSSELSEMLEREFEDSDVLLMAAAVSDYKVSTAPATGKIERRSGIHLQLEPTSDIVSNLRGNDNGRLKVGFAAEFGADKIENARRKMKEKNLGMIVFNDVSRADVGLESEDNEITILMPGNEDLYVEKATKRECADRILDRVAEAVE